jgi:hypothetical protein
MRYYGITVQQDYTVQKQVASCTMLSFAYMEGGLHQYIHGYT